MLSNLLHPIGPYILSHYSTVVLLFTLETCKKQNQQNFDRMSEGSGATEDGDDHLGQDYVGGGDDGRYPEKAQLEEAGYRYESALRSCGHGRAQWQVSSKMYKNEKTQRIASLTYYFNREKLKLEIFK